MDIHNHKDNSKRSSIRLYVSCLCSHYWLVTKSCKTIWTKNPNLDQIFITCRSIFTGIFTDFLIIRTPYLTNKYSQIDDDTKRGSDNFVNQNKKKTKTIKINLSIYNILNYYIVSYSL